MKTFRLIGMALVAMCLCMNFASCSNEDVLAPEDPQEEKYVTVGLGCTGEFLEFSDSPLSRNSVEELYGIQVYALTEMENGKCRTTPYAYGMFTSLENVNIKLLQEQKYRFIVSIVIDPFKTSTSWFNGGYFENYYEANGTEFAYSASQYLNLISVYDDRHKHDRYYGELDQYTPTENGNVDIYTKRVAYGVRYEIVGLNADESITVGVNSGNDPLYDVELGTETHEGIYTFQFIDSAWKGKLIGKDEETGEPKYGNYSSEKQLSLRWNKVDGTSVSMGTYNVTFKRNVMTTIRIKADNLDMENGIKVFKEEVAMVPDENIYEIEGGTVTEVPVVSGN